MLGGNSPIQHANPEKEASSTIEIISKKYKFDIY